MRHKTIKKVLPNYLDGNLDPAKRQEIEDHLTLCSSCRKQLEHLKLLLDEPDLSIFPQLKPDPFLPDRIRAGARRKTDGKISIIPRSVSLRPVLLTILCLAAFFFGGWMGQWLGKMSAANETPAAYTGFMNSDSTTTFNGLWVETMDDLVGVQK